MLGDSVQDHLRMKTTSEMNPYSCYKGNDFRLICPKALKATTMEICLTNIYPSVCPSVHQLFARTLLQYLWTGSTSNNKTNLIQPGIVCNSSPQVLDILQLYEFVVNSVLFLQHLPICIDCYISLGQDQGVFFAFMELHFIRKIILNIICKRFMNNVLWSYIFQWILIKILYKNIAS